MRRFLPLVSLVCLTIAACSQTAPENRVKSEGGEAVSAARGRKPQTLAISSSVTRCASATWLSFQYRRKLSATPTASLPSKRDCVPERLKFSKWEPNPGFKVADASGTDAEGTRHRLLPAKCPDQLRMLPCRNSTQTRSSSQGEAT